jgi:hypothetical protein
MSEWEPEEIVIARPRPWGKLLLVVLLAVACIGGVWYLRERIMKTNPSRLAVVAQHVRSDVTSTGDSLEIVVSWQFTDSVGMPQPDSARLEVGLEGADPRVVILPAKQLSDTLRIGAPPAGQSAMGHSCVSGVHGSRLSGESCTPWQFVRPAADTVPSKPARGDSADKKTAAGTTGAAKGPVILRLVVRPSGRQVDPDIAGKCAAWQRAHPGHSVWLRVNDTAVPECMGPNGKPTVAQFCAFAVLQDGSRVKTENSTNNPYCEELYQIWVGERIS